MAIQKSTCNHCYVHLQPYQLWVCSCNLLRQNHVTLSYSWMQMFNSRGGKFPVLETDSRRGSSTDIHLQQPPLPFSLHLAQTGIVWSGEGVGCSTHIPEWEVGREQGGCSSPPLLVYGKSRRSSLLSTNLRISSLEGMSFPWPHCFRAPGGSKPETRMQTISQEKLSWEQFLLCCSWLIFLPEWPFFLWEEKLECLPFLVSPSRTAILPV